MPPVKGRGTGARPLYDPAEGDDDLYAGDLSGSLWRRFLVIGVIVGIALGVGIGLIIGQITGNGDGSDSRAELQIGTPGGTASPGSPSTAAQPAFSPTPQATASPTIALATVTPAPPTPTDTPTPGPCMQTAQEGDTVYGMAIRCGHQDMSVVDMILEMNGMDSAEQLQLGQTLEIPWPTPTPGGEPPTEAAPETGSDGEGVETSALDTTVMINEFGTPDVLATYQLAEPTLRPGQAWHTIQAGETILSIAVQYETTVETLSQINPEVPFLQCDYGMASGGANCSVMLYEGQRLRVPVPLPTETPTPTPVGTLTPTPTITPTFNAPYLTLPEDGAHFNADQMVTLRWGSTGTLAENERYIVRVRDLDTGEEYVAPVQDTMYVLPGGWQPEDRDRHTFEWTISTGIVDDQYNILNEEHFTDPRRFTWDSR